jgi:pulcherriminic acid synthase
MLGLPREDHDRFHGWYTSIMGFLGNLAGDEAVAAEGLRTKAEFEDYMVPRIRERRAHPGDDLLSTLCAAEIDGESMTDEEIKAFCSLLLTAGGETTDKAVTSLMANLVAHPEQLEAVRADRSLIPAAFAETLRWSPPVHMIMRQPAEDVELSGGAVEAGRTVTCLIGAANRDDRRFDRPEVFDVLRADLDGSRAFSAAADHLAFCLGRHFCVGALLSLFEIEVGVNDLLDAMTDIRFADGAPPPESGVFTRAPSSLHLQFTPAAEERP